MRTVGWILLSFSLCILFGIVTFVLFAFKHTSVSFRRVKPGRTYKVHDQTRVVPKDLDIQFKAYFVTEKDRNAMWRHLKHVVEVFDKHDIPYWLMCGSLLGLVRHQGFLPWDDDVDVGVERKTMDALEKIPWEDYELRLHKMPRIWKIQGKKHDFPFVDVLPFAQEAPEQDHLKYCMPLNDQGECTYEVAKDWPREICVLKDLYPLGWADFEGIRVRVPKDPVAVVTQMFTEESLTVAKEGRWTNRNLPWFFSHKFAAKLGLMR